jgi:hypothetical protein
MTVLKRLLAVAAISGGFMLPPVAIAAPQHHHKPVAHKLVVPPDYAAWSHVASCESGGWQVLGSAYPDALGITRTNYTDYGGAPQPPGPVSMQERVVMIHVADRLIAAYHVGIPDQGGCAAW